MSAGSAPSAADQAGSRCSENAAAARAHCTFRCAVGATTISRAGRVRELVPRGRQGERRLAGAGRRDREEVGLRSASTNWSRAAFCHGRRRMILVIWRGETNARCCGRCAWATLYDHSGAVRRCPAGRPLLAKSVGDELVRAAARRMVVRDRDEHRFVGSVLRRQLPRGPRAPSPARRRPPAGRVGGGVLARRTRAPSRPAARGSAALAQQRHRHARARGEPLRLLVGLRADRPRPRRRRTASTARATAGSGRDRAARSRRPPD